MMQWLIESFNYVYRVRYQNNLMQRKHEWWMPYSDVVNQGQFRPRASVAIVGASLFVIPNILESDGVDVKWYRGP